MFDVDDNRVSKWLPISNGVYMYIDPTFQFISWLQTYHRYLSNMHRQAEAVLDMV